MGDDDSSTTNGENGGAAGGGARGGVGGGAATTTHEHDMEERLIRAIQVSGLNQSPQFKSRRYLAMIQIVGFPLACFLVPRVPMKFTPIQNKYY